MVRLLLHSGAHPDGRPDFEGGSPILAALTKGHLDIALELFSRGAQTSGIKRKLLQPLINFLGPWSR